MFWSFITLMRPYQYTKNLFIFAPAFFAFQITNISVLFLLSIIFLAFCFLCSSVYIFNDILDRDQDKLHPTKKLRPIAAGTISVSCGALFGCLLFLSAFLLILISNDLLFYFSTVILHEKSLHLSEVAPMLTTGGGG